MPEASASPGLIGRLTALGHQRPARGALHDRVDVAVEVAVQRVGAAGRQRAAEQRHPDQPDAEAGRAAASSMVGSVVTSSSSMIRGLVSRNNERRPPAPDAAGRPGRAAAGDRHGCPVRRPSALVACVTPLSSGPSGSRLGAAAAGCVGAGAPVASATAVAPAGCGLRAGAGCGSYPPATGRAPARPRDAMGSVTVPGHRVRPGQQQVQRTAR